MFRISCLAIFIFFLVAHPAATQRMDNKKMEKIFEKEAIKVEGEPGAWMAYFDDYVLLVITDEPNNRMRIFTPIVEEENIGSAEMSRMLKANFHSALDAKYSVYEGFVVSVFTHPLRELTEEQFLDALKQVAKLAETFGTTYSSSGLIFGSEQEESQPEEKKPGEKRS